MLACNNVKYLVGSKPWKKFSLSIVLFHLLGFLVELEMMLVLSNMEWNWLILALHKVQDLVVIWYYQGHHYVGYECNWI